MIDINKARDKIEEIVNTREYAIYYEDNRNFLQRRWDSIKEWFNELLESVFGSIAPSSGLASLVVGIVTIVVLILLTLAIYFVARYYRRKHRFQEKANLFRMHEKDWTYADHVNEARTEEEKGNLQGATRHLFLALLIFSHEKGFIETRIWKTNTDYYQELKQVKQKKADEFYQLAKRFEDVVYGEQPVETNSFQQYKEAVLVWMDTSPENESVEELGGDH